ncbi:MAG: glycosyltransferase [Verrucomicrobiae bacterium]|nr:glycosyltransferase [Verrucomicrobiae bacterium]MDW8308067.1 glycosyltransferase [Verrucomicrobiales bacterium]
MRRPNPVTDPAGTSARVSVDGKFFRRGAAKLHLKGVAYGPFAPDAEGVPFASREQTGRDFALARELGANLLRLYHVPPRWLLDLALEHDLLLLIDVPWDKARCCLDGASGLAAAREAVRRAVRNGAHHPAVLGYSVANEIPPDVVRWCGARRVAEFIDQLVLAGRDVDPEALFTFANFPPTEFVQPQTTDFVCFNVYLHQRAAFKNYLARLQMLADGRPLVLGEFGIDSLREGEAAKCAMLGWQIEEAFRGGLAGAIVFSFTDDWHHGGRPVADWQMGLTTARREPKPSFHVVAEKFRAAPYFPLARYPRVSVVVAAYNADRTLKPCLESLRQLRYPDYEVILVDDGSTDTTPQLAAQFPSVRSIRHVENRGLSAARNTGIAAATGEIVAFTDADCRADEDWLYHLVGTLLEGEFAGAGGPNLLPPEDSPVAAAVMVSPGGPAHVMLDDRHAEHIPGCNMAFWREALLAVGGFDPIFTQAGDDVDLCWRLQQAGYKIGFSPGAFVWHYRRSTVRAYLRQQRGYGAAEALLALKHPEHFNSLGGSIWRGRIYAAGQFGPLLRPPVIYHGVFGSAPFQALYAAAPANVLMLCTTLEYHALVTLPLWVLSVPIRALLPVAVASLLLSVAVCVAAGAQARLPPDRKRWWSRPLVALLFLLQPLVRGWARYAGRLAVRPMGEQPRPSLDSLALRDSGEPLDEVRYWGDRRHERVGFVARFIEALRQRGWPHRPDVGWSEFDVELYGSRWAQVQLITASEDYPEGRRLLRCRLRARTTLLARVALAALLGVEALVIGWLGKPLFGLALAGTTLVACGWFLRRQKRHLQAMTIVFLDAFARDLGLLKLPSTPPSVTSGGTQPAQAAPVSPDSPADAGASKVPSVEKFPPA